MDYFYAADIYLFKLINQIMSNSFFDWLFPAITDLHFNKSVSITAIIGLCLILIRKFGIKSLLHFLFLIFALSVGDFTGAKIKRIVERPRPFQNIDAQAVKRSPASENTSFYSNHASNTFTFATYAGFLFPQVKIVFITIATLVSYSRVYNGVHYPSDVFTGAMMGILWGYLFHFLCFAILKRPKNEEA